MKHYLAITLIFLAAGMEVKAEGTRSINREYDLFIIVEHDSEIYSSHLESTWVNYKDCEAVGKNEVKELKLNSGEIANHYCMAVNSKIK